MKFFAGVIVTLVTIMIVGLIILYSGWYNVSAANNVSGFEKWFFSTASDNSVEKHAESITVPDLNSPEKIKEGFAHYDEMCKGCHGAPGMTETELAKGLNPKAPNLSKSATEMSVQELFWVTKNGIKMTGMPAWGKTHSDDKIWSMVAFIEKLPGMKGAEYDTLKAHSKPVMEENE